jgi:hypothetical protein
VDLINKEVEMLSVGTLLRCKTTTKNDVFGTVIWEVVETGLTAPEKGREECKDGVKVILLGGSGSAARPGMTLLDSEEHIMRDIQAGITSILKPDQKETALGQFRGKANQKVDQPRHSGSGVVDWP